MRPSQAGFTLIELIVVLAIVALMLTIAAPRYIDHVERSRETTLRASLKVMREAIDKFEGDTGKLPASLEELVQRRYLRDIPVDPITGRRDSWRILTPGELPPQGELPPTALFTAPPAPSGNGPLVADVRSGAQGNTRDGTSYQDL